MDERSYNRPTGHGGINIALGIWTIISPFVLGFAGIEAAKWNNIAVGGAVIFVALRAASPWNLLLAVWLIVSPFFVGFVRPPAALWNNVSVGALIGLVAILGNWGRRAHYGTPPPAG